MSHLDSGIPVFVLGTGTIIKMTCTAHVPSLPASIEWYRIGKSQMSRVLWNKEDFSPGSNPGTSCEYELTNQMPYFVEDTDTNGLKFECTIRSNGMNSSSFISLTVQ